MSPTPHLKQFGRYEIIRKLGRGMADVYLALDSAADRRAVLKIVEQCRDPLTETVVEAERRGAIIQQQLHALDPRILEIYEYGEQDGCFFVAMQYAEGKSLAEILRREGRLDPVRAARYAAEVCSQLGTLHSFQAEIDGRKQAVVHGDIKPSNIQIGPHEEVWLLDFGIAKAITLTRNLTHHNLGSPAYCSPERLRKAQVDPHADLWAAGVSLYEMVAGLPPYQAQGTRKLENLIQSRRPPRALPESCPPALKAVIAKALAADSERRYTTAAALEADLRSFIERGTAQAESERQPSWDANETLEKPRPGSTRRGVTGWRLWKFIPEYDSVPWAVLSGLIVALLCVIPAFYAYRNWAASQPLRAARDYTRSPLAKIAADWSLYQDLSRKNGFLGLFSPVGRLAQPLRARFLATADDVLERFRTGSDPLPEHFDWEKARACFSYALQLDDSDPGTWGKVALCDGYLDLVRRPVTPAAFRTARSNFELAAAYLPRSPDPHLGLARIQVYGFHNIGQAIAEFRTAERLGFRSGPREMEQQGDGYFYRARQEMRTWQRAASRTEQARYLALAQRDFARARSLYEPIAGFSNTGRSLEQLYRDEDLMKRLQAARQRAYEAARRRASRRSSRWR